MPGIVLPVSELLDQVLEAHGGLERWRAAKTIRAAVRAGGMLLRTRMPGNRFADYRLQMELAEPRIAMEPFPVQGQRAVFDHGRVRIETEGGDVVASRDDPRPLFFGRSGVRRNLRWDACDATYFAGYAMWNYLTTPLLFTREGMKVSEGGAWREAGEEWRCLWVEFPDGLDTHSRRQAFYVDDSGLLRRQDYTAEVVSRAARTAHYMEQHREFGGLVFPTKRRVVPRGPGGRSLRLPVMVWLEIDEIEVSS